MISGFYMNTHMCTHAHMNMYTYCSTLSLSLPLSHTHTHIALSLSLSDTHTLSHSLTETSTSFSKVIRHFSFLLALCENSTCFRSVLAFGSVTFVYVCLCLCVCSGTLFVWACIHMCMHVEARGQLLQMFLKSCPP